MKPMDITNQKYNKLLAVRFIERDKHGNAIWECLCDCGNTSFVRLGALRAGQIKQCFKCSSNEKVKYNIKNDRIKSIYSDIKRRCYDESRKAFHRYGGRGIKMCDEWLKNPASFEKWSLENEYSDDLSIDRIDNDGDYEPSNCRWVDVYVQANNRSDNNVIEYQGDSLTVSQWARKIGVDKSTIYNRINNGETLDAVLSPVDIRQQKSKSGIKGIHWISARRKWVVIVKEGGKKLQLELMQT